MIAAHTAQGRSRMRRSWTSQEDAVLVKRVKLFGVKQWSKVAEGIPSRTGKSCSERWRHFLDPEVKSPSKEAFSSYEAAVIVRAHEIYGNKWQAIAELLPGRSCRAVKNFYHTNMGVHAMSRGAIMISNPLLAEGHSLEVLLANAPQPSAAPSASSACAASGMSSQDMELPTPGTDHHHQLFASQTALPPPAAAILSLVRAPSPQPQLQFLQLLSHEAAQEQQQQQQQQLLLPSARLQSSNTAMLQQVMASDQANTLPRMLQHAAAPARALVKQSHSSGPSTLNTRHHMAARGDTLCEQLLHGFGAASACESPAASGSGDSSAATTQQAGSHAPSTPRAANIGQAVAAPPQLLQPLAGQVPAPADAMEALFDNLSASEVQALLADFWGEAVPPQHHIEELWGGSSAAAAAAAATMPACLTDATAVALCEPRITAAATAAAAAAPAIVPCRQCPRCQAEAAAAAAAASGAGAVASPTPKSHPFAHHPPAPWVRPPPLAVPSPVLGSAGSLSGGAGSTSSGNNLAAINTGVPAPAMQMQREGSVNSCMGADGLMDVFQVSCLLAQQQQRLAQQQQELLKQQQQLEALQTQLAQRTQALLH